MKALEGRTIWKTIGRWCCFFFFLSREINTHKDNCIIVTAKTGKTTFAGKFTYSTRNIKFFFSRAAFISIFIFNFYSSIITCETYADTYIVVKVIVAFVSFFARALQEYWNERRSAFKRCATTIIKKKERKKTRWHGQQKSVFRSNVDLRIVGANDVEILGKNQHNSASKKETIDTTVRPSNWIVCFPSAWISTHFCVFCCHLPIQKHTYP